MGEEVPKLSHLDDEGRVRMVDVTDKAETSRRARARARIRLSDETMALIRSKGLRKGDVLEIARIAGIMGAKKTSELIPLCHPLPVSGIDVRIDEWEHGLELECTARVTGRTGVEMEAMTGAAIAALTVYDMCKSADKGIEIESIHLLKKEGGKSGTWTRDED